MGEITEQICNLSLLSLPGTLVEGPISQEPWGEEGEARAWNGSLFMASSILKWFSLNEICMLKYLLKVGDTLKNDCIEHLNSQQLSCLLHFNEKSESMSLEFYVYKVCMYMCVNTCKCMYVWICVYIHTHTNLNLHFLKAKALSSIQKKKIGSFYTCCKIYSFPHLQSLLTVSPLKVLGFSRMGNSIRAELDQYKNLWTMQALSGNSFTPFHIILCGSFCLRDHIST